MEDATCHATVPRIKTIVLASLIAGGLLCYCIGGDIANVGVPLSAVLALALLFIRKLFSIFSFGKSSSSASPEPPSSLFPRLAERAVENALGEPQISALGLAFRKQEWALTEKTIDAILDRCLTLVRGRLDAHTIAVFFPTDADGYRLRRFWSQGQAIIADAELRPGLGVVGSLLKDGLKTLSLREIMSDSTTLYYYREDTGIRSLIASPIVTAGSPRGLIIADSTQKNAFTNEHSSFLSDAAGILGEAVYQAYVCTEHRLEHLRLAAASHVEKRFFKEQSVDEILTIIADIIPFAFTCDRMTISMRTEDGKGGVIKRASGADADTLRNRQFSLSEKTLASVLYTKNICFSRNFSPGRHESRYFENEPHANEYGSFLAVPLGIDDCKGMILLESVKRDAFSDALRELLSTIAVSAGLAIEKILLYEKTNALATHDGLTNLFNHRQFQQILKDEITRSSRYTDPLSLVICDIDFFKKVNDTYGHPFGDAVLKTVAGILNGSIRQGIDTAARYGGEEFALILVKTDEAQAIETAERIRESIARTVQKSPSGADVHVTMSFGIAVLGKHARELGELVKKADKALYRAKEQGRNRVEVF
jgi:diguanylate cyclase (GGDEF)-like protein